VVQIEKKLPQTSLSQWQKRGTVDCIIMIDWNGSASRLPPRTPLSTLKDALYKVIIIIIIIIIT